MRSRIGQIVIYAKDIKFDSPEYTGDLTRQQRRNIANWRPIAGLRDISRPEETTDFTDATDQYGVVTIRRIRMNPWFLLLHLRSEIRTAI
jgi:hypothetical protein